VTELFDKVRERVRRNVPVVIATVVGLDGSPPPSFARLGATLVVSGDGPSAGSLDDDALDRIVEADARRALLSGSSGLRRYAVHGARDGRPAAAAEPESGGLTEASGPTLAVFIHAIEPPPRMIVLGAADVSAALVRVAKVLGFRVTVCDARPAFATRTRFPDADEVVVDWPHRHLAAIADELEPCDAVCVLTHDAKFDVPALVAALATRAGYVGALGSRRTHADRVARLRAEGVAETDIARVMAPIGIDLGGRTPAETAVSICAEIVASFSGTPAASLRDGSGPIHRPTRA